MTRASIGCATCGAHNPEPFRQCWLCGTPLVVGAREMTSNPYAAPAFEGATYDTGATSFKVTAVALTLGVVTVIAPLLWTNPGLGIVLAIGLGPALVRTVLVMDRRARVGKHDSLLKSFGMFLGSFVVTITIVFVACVVTFGAFCLTLCGTMSRSSQQSMALPVLAAVLAAGVVGLLSWIWIAERWRESVGDGPHPPNEDKGGDPASEDVP